MTAVNDNVKGKERLLVKAIPEHRIEQIKYRDRVVWCKQQRIDLVFGSGNSSSLESRETILDVISTYDNWSLEAAAVAAARVAGGHLPIYCMLEDVLIDFEAAVRKEFKGKKSSQISPKLLWSHIAELESFYSTTADDPGRRLLWPVLARHNVTILTLCPDKASPPTNPAKDFCRRTLSTDLTVISCGGKSVSVLSCLARESRAVLLASRLGFRKPWEDGGGVFVHVDFSEEGLRKALEQLLTLGFVDSVTLVEETIERFCEMTAVLIYDD